MQPGCAAVVNAVNFAVSKSHSFSGRLLDRLGLYKLGLVRRNYQAISEVLPLKKLEILIFSFDIEDSLKLCTQIRAGVFPYIRLLQTPTGYHLDLDGRIRRAVMALEQAMDARSIARELDEYRSKEVTLSVSPDDNRHQMGIVGCGKMGIRIACELLRRGCTIFMWDNDAFRRRPVRKSVRAMLLTFRCFDQIHIEQLLQRLHIAEHLEELIGCRFPTVIEAVSENVDIKQQVFADIFVILKHNCVPPDRVCMCSNSMSIPIEQVNGLDEVYSHRCIGLRFLDPVVLVDRVEVTAPQSPNAIYVLRTVETTVQRRNWNVPK